MQKEIGTEGVSQFPFTQAITGGTVFLNSALSKAVSISSEKSLPVSPQRISASQFVPKF